MSKLDQNCNPLKRNTKQIKLLQATGALLMSKKYDVATVLERESETTIANWYALVEAESDLRAIPLSREDRCTHLREMFRDLVNRLRNPLPLGTHAQASAAARDHGCLRRDQGYTAAMLVVESRILQVSIFQTLQIHVEDTKSNVLLMYIMAIADEVDSQLTQAMKSYISEANLDAQPMGA